MAAQASIDAIEWLRKQIEESAPDPLKTMLVEMVNLLMSAEVDAICGAPACCSTSTVSSRWRRARR